MALFRARTDAEGALGEWYVFGQDPEDHKPVRFRIRALPALKEREIVNRHVGAKTKITHRRGGAEQLIDGEAQTKANIDAAIFCLTASEHFSGLMEDMGAAEIFTKLLGRPVKAGDTIAFDDCLEAVKAQILHEQPEFASWVATRAKSQRMKADEEEEGKERS